jgi:hypothetical protein
MAEFLSDAWIAELDDAVRGADGLTVTDGVIVIEQVVRGGPGGEVRYQVRFGPDGARVVAGAPDLADLTLLTDHVTARTLHDGRGRAQDALATGFLKVHGRPEVLAKRAELFARLDAAFAPVRARTTFPGSGFPGAGVPGAGVTGSGGPDGR